ncbi:hypothetical protein ABZ260_41805 [Streptosporangium sp. NPDC006013]|uniref:effector-associated constant component EACC1 n=1 Tax=Streptosporangium sp. NPDC006013 TaxID=3155596 RepID=UPI00339FBFF1
MDILVTMGTDAPADQMRDLRAWLVAESGLQGRVRVVDAMPPEGALGLAPETLQIVFGAGGVIASVTSVVIAWLGTRKNEISVKIARGDESVEISAKGIQALDLDGTQALARQLARVLTSAPSAAADDAG